MTIFDKTAVEAAAKAIRDDRTAYETAEQFSLAKATAALSAAEASMRERGLARDGAGCLYHKHRDTWCVWETAEPSPYQAAFPVTIIRKETP